MSTAAVRRNIPVALPSFGEAEEQALLTALRSGWVSQGPRVAEFERNFGEYVGAPHAVAVSSCTAALHLALVTSGIRSGDEVICPSLSFVATANAIVYAGASPVFVDIDDATYNLSPQAIESAITSRTRAILVVHQVGMPAALNEITQIANRHGLIVIEDAACAVGAEYKGSRIGHPHSSMACFSFHPRKILTTGEGGMITTADGALADRLRRLRQHAMNVSDLARHSANTVVSESYDEVGFNYRMTDLQAAIGLVQLKRLDEMIARRRWLAQRYTSSLSSIPWLITPQEPADCRANFQSFMVRLRNDAPVSRNQLMQELLNRGIYSRRGIMAIHREAPYRSEHWDLRLPLTSQVSDTTVILPLFHDMAPEDQDRVVAAIEAVGESAPHDVPRG